MSTATTRVLAEAAGTPLCDCVVIGVKPDGSLHIDWTGSTLGSLILYLRQGFMNFRQKPAKSTT